MAEENPHVAYHYTSDSVWQMIQHGYFQPSDSLVPYRELDMGFKEEDIPDFAHEKYLFAFLDESVPGSWEENPEFPNIWQRIMGHVCHGDLVVRLLSFEITPEDEAYVADWAHIARENQRLWKIYLRTASEEDRAEVKSALMKYLASRVPLADYDGLFCLPELMIRNPVSIDRLAVVEWPYI